MKGSTMRPVVARMSQAETVGIMELDAAVRLSVAPEERHRLAWTLRSAAGWERGQAVVLDLTDADAEVATLRVFHDMDLEVLSWCFNRDMGMTLEERLGIVCAYLLGTGWLRAGVRYVIV